MTYKNLDKQRIEELVENMARPIENAPAHQIIGTDGLGWYQQVGHVHDSHSNKANLAELRLKLRHKITAQIDSHKDRPQQKLFKMLELAIIRSDKSLFQLAALVGMKPSEGLYEKIKSILVDEDNLLDAKSPLWKLMGVND
jgi:hypothetical protein